MKKVNDESPKSIHDESESVQTETASGENKSALDDDAERIDASENIVADGVGKTPTERSFNSNFGNSTNKQVNVLNAASINIGTAVKDDKISLIEKSKPYYYQGNNQQNEHLQYSLDQLKEKNILLLGGEIFGKLPHISYQLAASLEIADKKNDIRHFSLKSETDKELDIHSFSFEREDIETSIAVIIDATKSGDKFTDSLLEGEATLESQLLGRLKANKMFLICLVSSKPIEAWLKRKDDGQTGFPHWILSSETNKKLTSETSLKFDELLDDLSPEDSIIMQTILFVGAFFPNLFVSDFTSLVEAWLSLNGEVKTAYNSEEVEDETKFKRISLKQLWDLKSDYYFRKSFLRQSKTADNKRIIAFAGNYDPKLAMEILEEQMPIATQKKIASIAELGLVFHPSEDVAGRSISVFTERFSDDEESNINWLLRIFNFLNGVEHLTETLDVLDVLGVIPQQNIRNKEKELKEKNFYYNRLAKIFREMLRSKSFRVVEEIIERLIQDKSYRVVLLLIKRLQYAPNFDEFYWLKQLAERGDNSLRESIEAYLLNNLINGKTSVENLTEWLPERELPFERSSRINEMALRVFIKYLITITQNFDEELLHLEPTEFPLFIYGERNDADEKLDFIAKYLLHPWKNKIWQSIWSEIREDIKRFNTLPMVLLPQSFPFISLLAQIIEKWSFILYAPPKSRTEHGTQISGEDNNSHVGNAVISNILLEKIISYADKSQQREIIAFWKEMKNTLAEDITAEQYSSFKEREMILKRKVFISKLEEVFTKKTYQRN